MVYMTQFHNNQLLLESKPTKWSSNCTLVVLLLAQTVELTLIMVLPPLDGDPKVELIIGLSRTLGEAAGENQDMSELLILLEKEPVVLTKKQVLQPSTEKVTISASIY